MNSGATLKVQEPQSEALLRSPGLMIYGLSLAAEEVPKSVFFFPNKDTQQT